MTIAVIGGGVIGLNSAWSLSKKGFDVSVFEAKEIGNSASAVNAGWVVPSLSTPLASPGILKEGLTYAFSKDSPLSIRPQPDLNWLKWLWKFQRSSKTSVYESGVRALMDLNNKTMDLFDELKEDGVDFEMHETGILALAMQPEGLQWFSQLFDLLIPMGFKGSIEYLSGDEARKLDPSVSNLVQKAAFTSIDRFVNPESLLSGLAKRLQEMNVTINENCPVSSIKKDDDSWLVQSEKGTTKVANIIIALGAKTNDLLTPLGIRLPIMGGKGYSLELKGEGIAPAHAMYLMESKVGLSPGNKGVRIAGVFEMPGKDDEISERRMKQLIDQTVPYLDSWHPGDQFDFTVGRAGLRPSTPDSLPFVGEVPNNPNLYVAAGHGMLGVTLAPATANALTEMITENHIPDHLLPFQFDGRI